MKNRQAKIRFGSHNVFVHGLATFFLLFACADLSFPQVFCPEELGGQINLRSFADLKTSATSNDKEKSVIAVKDGDNSSPDEPSRQAPQEEECFCCCGHIVPVVIFINCQALIVKSPPFMFDQDRLPTTPPQSPFRPPRYV